MLLKASISRLNALLTSYLFLLWFDTRSGYQDTGPYELPDGRVVLLRAYNRLGVSHFPWSSEVSAAMPSGSSPNAHVTRPGAAIAIGPCRYSFAGYDSVQDCDDSRIFSAASCAMPTLQPVPRNEYWSASTSSRSRCVMSALESAQRTYGSSLSTSSSKH